PSGTRMRADGAWVGTALGLFALNVWVQWRDPRTDLTAAQLHTLAPQTLSVLQKLSGPVTATAFVADAHPASKSLDVLLGEYARASEGRFRAHRIDPRQHPTAAAAAGVREGEHAIVLERTSPTPARTVLAAVSEQELTGALMSLDRARATRVLFLAGQGEGTPPLPDGASIEKPSDAPLSSLASALAQEGFALHTANRSQLRDIPQDADLVVVANPQVPFSEDEQAMLRRYMEDGGRLALFVEPNVRTGLERLLSELGIELDRGVIADASAHIENVYVPVASEFGTHPITRVLKEGKLSLQLPTARGLTLLRSGLSPDVLTWGLAYTSADAWEERDAALSPVPSDGEKSGRLLVAAAGSRARPGGRRSPQARWVVVGEADLLRDVLWHLEGNRNFVLNALNWAGQHAEGITLRPKIRPGSSLTLTSAQHRRLRILGGEVLPLSLGAIAVVLAARRKGSA
ncbi:MAG: GldG family protein, partial [Myxococcaceae bacterium]